MSSAFVDATDGSGGFAVAQTDATGAYSLAVDNGTWSLRAHSMGYEGGPVSVIVNNNSPSSQTITLSAISGFTVKAEKQETVTPTSGGYLTNTDIGSLFKVQVPANALGTSSNAATVKTQSNTAMPNSSSGTVLKKNAVTISAVDSTGQQIKSLNDDITIVIPYTAADVSALASESDLVIGVWNDATSAYDILSTTVDTTADTLTATVSHLSDFAPLYSTGGGAPATPSGLAGTSITSALIRLSWNEVSNSTGYDIYRSATSDGTFALVGSEPTVSGGTTLTYDNTGLTSSTTYYYKVSAVNGSGESAASSAVSVSTSGGGGGGGGGTTRLVITNERIEEIIPGLVFIRWDTNISATRRVVYGQPTISDLGLSPNYGYDASTVELTSPLLTSHGMAVVGLTPGETYHFRPVSTNGSLLAVGEELTFVPAGGGTGGGCDYLFDYLKIGFENDPVEVRKLQIFLRDLEGFSNLAVTGVFDQATFDAVSAFQLRYQDDILTPWGYKGTSTGFVYILTKKKVNEIYCKFAFPVTVAQQSEIDTYRTFLESLQREGVPTGGTAPIENVPAVPNILETGAQIGQLPATEQTQVTTTLVLNTATTSPTGGVLRNLAAAVLALPQTTEEAFDCVYKLIAVLLGLYLLSLLMVAMFDNGMSYRKIVSFRIMSLIFGIIIAVPVSIVLLAYCLVIPLLVVLIILAGFLLWYVNKKDDDDTPLPPSDVIDSSSTIFPPFE